MTLMRDQLPHKGLEAWKWSDLRAASAALSDDRLAATMAVDLSLPKDLSSSLSEATEPVDEMGRVAAHYVPHTQRIDVPAGTKLDQPLELTTLANGHARLHIQIGEGAQVSVVERYASDAAGFANLDIRYTVKEGATLHRTVTTEDHADTLRHVRANIELWNGATFEQVQLTTGSKLTRLETRLACLGAVEATLSGAYMLSGQRHADITNYTDLTAPDCVIRDEIAGVVTDKGRGVFQGKFHVRRPAQQTDAEMRHDALMLSETARINAKPELEIYADDVECAHGNTIGQLDEQALFYMRQRGIPLAQARALLIEAFIVARLGGDDAMVERVRAWLAQSS